MKTTLLALASVLFFAGAVSAQAWNSHAYDREAAEHGLDSADYFGYNYFMEYGHANVQSRNMSSFRYEPSAGAPLFVDNPGFESGDFTGWQGAIGDNTVSSSGPLQNVVVGIYNGSVNPQTLDANARHSIMSSAPGNDPEGGFPVVPAGYGTYTARLGNSYAQYQGQFIEQARAVSLSDTAFVISYAVVVYDGAHPAGEGSYFQIDILDSNLNTIIYTRHDESNALPATYQPAVSGQTSYLAWERDTFDLSAAAGHTVIIRFTAAGCIWSGHYCYAYVDCDPDNANTIGIHEHNAAHVDVYPNPSATGIFQVNIAGQSDAPVVYDMSGRTVNAALTKTASGWIVDISTLAPGVYSLSIHGENGVSRTTLVR